MSGPTATAAPNRPTRAKVTVTDVDTGAPLKGAHVEIWSIHEGNTKSDGSWTSKVFPSGAYDLKVFLAGFGPVPAPGVPRVEFTFIQSVTFLPLTSATGPVIQISVQLAQALPRAIVTVIDPTQGNELVKGAEVEVTGANQGLTEANGVYTSPPFAMGIFDVKVRKIFYGPPVAAGTVVEGEALQQVNFNQVKDFPLTISLVNTIGKVRSSNITVGKKPFVSWFNNDFRSRMPKTHPTVKIGGAPAPVFPSTVSAARFQDAYDNCGRILAPQMSLEEFIATFLIIYNESGGTLLPVSEKGSPKYMFEPDATRHKASYNSGGNRKAGDQLLAQGAISDPADVEAWNGVVWPDPEPGSALEAAALECDFFKFRGRGFIQITFRSTYLAHVAPAMRAAGLAQPGQSDSDMLDAMSEAALGNLILTDPNIFFPMTRSYFLSIRSKLDQVNGRVWKPFALAIAGNNPPYAELYDFRCNNLLDEMKKDGVVLA